MVRDKGEKIPEEELMYQRRITSVVAITPVYNEAIFTIQHFNSRIEEIRDTLINRSISFRHFFLDDAALNLPREEISTLVTHTENQGLAQTLLDGYRAALDLSPQPDLIIRLDSQEHSPFKILEVVDHMMNTEAEAVFLPIWYKTHGEPAPLTTEIYEKLNLFRDALTPLREEEILEAYIRFPLGFQCFTTNALQKILPKLERGIELSVAQNGERATWGLDLLAILLTAQDFEDKFDFLWGGWSTPWKSNRSFQKTEDQKRRARSMLAVAKELSEK